MVSCHSLSRSLRMSWCADDIPDLSAKVGVVTCGNGGIGYWTGLHLARKGAQVMLACRSPARAEAALATMRAAAPTARIDSVPLDLADLASVRNAAAEFAGQHRRLDILCLNSGIALSPMGRTQDGFESQFGSNFLGHFALTGQLIDVIRATPDCRVVPVCSLTHRTARIDFDDTNLVQGRYST